MVSESGLTAFWADDRMAGLEMMMRSAHITLGVGCTLLWNWHMASNYLNQLNKTRRTGIFRQKRQQYSTIGKSGSSKRGIWPGRPGGVPLFPGKLPPGVRGCLYSILNLLL